MTTAISDLTYEQRLELGKIIARTQFGQESLSKATAASLAGDDARASYHFRESDLHNQEVINSVFKIAALGGSATIHI